MRFVHHPQTNIRAILTYLITDQTTAMIPLPPSTPVIQRVMLRTQNAARLATFYHNMLGLLPNSNTSNPRLISLIHPLSGTELLTLIQDPGARPAPPQAPGLFHTAFLFPEVADWGNSVKRAVNLSNGAYGASDHGVSWAVYLADPDGNGIELAWDKPPHEWPWRGDRIHMVTRPLPLRSILLDQTSHAHTSGAFFIGHLHLQVRDLELAETYQERLGMHITQSDYPGALFMARDGYHHHFAINTWRTNPQIHLPANAAGLIGWEMAETAETHEDWRDPNGFEVIGAHLLPTLL